jgi:hypothetical protein
LKTRRALVRIIRARFTVEEEMDNEGTKSEETGNCKRKEREMLKA